MSTKNICKCMYLYMYACVDKDMKIVWNGWHENLLKEEQRNPLLQRRRNVASFQQNPYFIKIRLFDLKILRCLGEVILITFQIPRLGFLPGVIYIICVYNHNNYEANFGILQHFGICLYLHLDLSTSTCVSVCIYLSISLRFHECLLAYLPIYNLRLSTCLLTYDFLPICVFLSIYIFLPAFHRLPA